MPELIKELQKKEEEELVKILSKKYGLPYINLEKITIELDALKTIPEKDARENFIAALQSTGKKLQVAVANPNIKSVQRIIENLKKQNYELKLYLASKSGLGKVFLKYKEIPPFEEIKPGIVEIKSAQKSNLKGIYKEISKENKNATLVIETLLSFSIGINASDIHIEPFEDGARLRLRLDGVLNDLGNIPLELYKILLSRIKLLSETKLNIHNKPQDGRFTIRIKKNNEDIEARTSILPGPYGESAAMRILLPQTIEMKMENLGMQQEILLMAERELKKPNGMIITTGPTGSGKTTTLYAFLKKVASSKIKVITIEDPIEYHLAGISQTQIEPDKGYNFSNGLKSILRQDPDVILVGEIRDYETASTAIHAALTGQLVFSTLHTNNAAGTIPRLIDLGVKPNIIAPAINVAIAQRLVRKLCENCKKETKLSPEEEKIIKEKLKGIKKNFQTQKAWKAVGCPKCNLTGYEGRTGIFEAFLVNDEIEKLILKNPAEAEIKKTAKKQGMLTIYQDGLLKVLKGITSFDELNRVASSED
ncbi:MAG: GspE/PulE family protein [Patescibacteria group bacterium]